MTSPTQPVPTEEYTGFCRKVWGLCLEPGCSEWFYGSGNRLWCDYHRREHKRERDRQRYADEQERQPGPGKGMPSKLSLRDVEDITRIYYESPEGALDAAVKYNITSGYARELATGKVVLRKPREDR